MNELINKLQIDGRDNGKLGMEETFQKLLIYDFQMWHIVNKEKIEPVSPMAVQRRVFLESFMAEVAFEMVPKGPGRISIAMKGQVRNW